LPWITERPLVAVASHCHFDHIAGHHEFAERLVHPAEADILAAPDGENDLSRAFVGDDMFEAHPDCPLCYAEYRVKAAPATGFVEDGDAGSGQSHAAGAAHAGAFTGRHQPV
jgi:glyoxylase-like metal-dependent hydrolase (beta-lactamase superfamily II)